MLLSQVRPQYALMNATERIEKLSAYRSIRISELTAYTEPKAKKVRAASAKKTQASNPGLSQKEKDLLKALGLSLRALKNVE